ncbi:MAG TPA: pyruvate formate-lyase-activating protein [Candidatus Acidoferrales bacterium]|nr:pyruvate formate-lyase-activating protein [Candidatus Acidoferrales bacterium]
MSTTDHPQKISLTAKSPFELRVNLGSHVPEADVRAAIASGDIGFFHSFTTGSTVDGPGVRVVAWLTGCQFRCLYCHNPDTWTVTNGIPVPINRAIDQLKKYRQGLKVMRGGFTISGGEPLMQHKFAVKLFSAARAMGIHTALDTNGHLGDRLSDADLESIDLVMLDIKSWDEERHKQVTGAEIGPVLAFARRLAERKRPVWLRYVLVPGLTDQLADIEKLAAFAGSLGNVDRVDVLPFHKMGEHKWKQLAIEYKLSETEPPSRELVEEVCARFRAAGLATV